MCVPSKSGIGWVAMGESLFYLRDSSICCATAAIVTAVTERSRVTLHLTLGRLHPSAFRKVTHTYSKIRMMCARPIATIFKSSCVHERLFDITLVHIEYACEVDTLFVPEQVDSWV